MENKEEFKKKTGVKCISSIDGIKRFSCCVMNPPYNENSEGDQFYVKFVNGVLDITDKCIFITPDIAYFAKNKKNKELKEKINKFKPEFIIGDWKDFDAAPNSRSCISIWNTKNPPEKIKVGNNYFDKQSDIILNDNPYLQEFFNKLNKYFETHDSVYDKCVANPKNKQYFDPTGRRKIKQTWENKNTWFTVFPYCVAAHFTTFYYEQYNDKLWNGPARILLPFDNKEHAKNCYLTVQDPKKNKGDLEPFYKIICNILTRDLFYNVVNRYSYFPYLNFSKTYSTEELFEIIGMEYDKNKVDKILKS